MSRKSNPPRSPQPGRVLPPEVLRRYSTPIAKTATKICKEVLADIQLISAGGADKARGIDSVKLSVDQRMDMCTSMSQHAADLAQALHRGDLDDPFAGWQLVARCARLLGPRYEAMLCAPPGQDTTGQAPRRQKQPKGLPLLTVNGPFMAELLAAGAPSVAIGLVEEAGQLCGMFALHLDGPLPNQMTGFRFGHSLLGNDEYIVLHFCFDFYGFARYEVVVDPRSPVVQACVRTMIETQGYHFFVVSTNGQATSFKSDPGDETCAGLALNWPQIQAATTTPAQFKKASQVFAGRLVESTPLNWVCRDDESYLDLSTDRLDLLPRG